MHLPLLPLWHICRQKTSNFSGHVIRASTTNHYSALHDVVGGRWHDDHLLQPQQYDNIPMVTHCADNQPMSTAIHPLCPGRSPASTQIQELSQILTGSLPARWASAKDSERWASLFRLHSTGVQREHPWEQSGGSVCWPDTACWWTHGHLCATGEWKNQVGKFASLLYIFYIRRV